MVDRKWLTLGVTGVGIVAALCSARVGLARMSDEVGTAAAKDGGALELAAKDGGIFELMMKDGGVFELTAKKDGGTVELRSGKEAGVFELAAKDGGGWELSAKKEAGAFLP
ncbi:MAG: hypothetical protein M3O46_11465 [Myxococcota bacterium]|nr:hypothetical protein [Myxococcota bacterium]